MRKIITIALVALLAAVFAAPVPAYEIGPDPQYVANDTYMPKLGVFTDIGPMTSQSETSPLPLPQDVMLWIFHVSDLNENVLLDPVTDFDTWADPSETQSRLEFAWEVYYKDGENWVQEYPYISGCVPFGCYSTSTSFSFSTLGLKKIIWKMRDIGLYDDSAHPDNTYTGYDAGGEMYIDVVDNNIVTPDAPIVTDDGAYTNSATTLHAGWSVANSGSGILGYQYKITDNFDYIVRDWTTVSRTTTEVTVGSLNLIEGRSYYFHVKAYGIGVWSDEGVSDGITCGGGNVIHVRTNGSDSNDGSTWELAKLTVTAALAAATSGKEVWVAEGLYYENITLASGVALYGGFSGSELAREQRSPKVHETILDGNSSGSVVAITANATSDTVIDGFAIRNGTGTYVDPTYYGGGIYCPSGSPTIANNIIKWNYTKGSGNTPGIGGGIYCGSGSPIITHNVITGNEARDGGGPAESIWLAAAQYPTT
jgi:hypothetical protein